MGVSGGCGRSAGLHMPPRVCARTAACLRRLARVLGAQRSALGGGGWTPAARGVVGGEGWRGGLARRTYSLGSGAVKSISSSLYSVRQAGHRPVVLSFAASSITASAPSPPRKDQHAFRQRARPARECDACGPVHRSVWTPSPPVPSLGIRTGVSGFCLVLRAAEARATYPTPSLKRSPRHRPTGSPPAAASLAPPSIVERSHLPERLAYGRGDCGSGRPLESRARPPPDSPMSYMLSSCRRPQSGAGIDAAGAAGAGTHVDASTKRIFGSRTGTDGSSCPWRPAPPCTMGTKEAPTRRPTWLARCGGRTASVTD
jgi:hypothetical protein